MRGQGKDRETGPAGGGFDTSPAREASGTADDDRGWRPLAAPAGSRDMEAGDRREAMRDAAEAYRVNPLAYRIVELGTDYVVGEGLRLAAEPAGAQAFLDAWWAANRMATRQYELCTELSLAGELFATFHTNPYDGMTYIRCLPAETIDQIESNPEDVEEEWRFHQVRSLAAGMLESGRWWAAEECRHYAVNRLVGAQRGQGDLTPLLPWLRRYKDWLTDRVLINRFKGAFLWDVKLEGASERAILARQAQLVEPPSPGSVLVHNEREEWRAVQPQIDGQAAEPDGKAMRLMLAAGAGIPLHFLAEAEDTNRSTAQEMVQPTLRHYARRQRYFGSLVEDIAREALRRSGRFGAQPVEVRAEFGGVEGVPPSP
jgi:hypothetical protein